MNSNIRLVVLAVIMAALMVFAYCWKQQGQGIAYSNVEYKDSSVEVYDLEREYTVKYIRVLEGNEFDLKLENGKRIKVRLPVVTVPEAKDKVVQYLNQCKQPKVVIFGTNGNVFIADLYVTEKSSSIGTETSLTEWLKESELVWDEP